MRTSLPWHDAGAGTLSRGPRLLDRWSLLALALALAVALPVLVVFASLLVPAGEIWRHLAETVLWDYVSNSALLAAGVGLGVIALGVGAAWLVSMCEFPGRGVFEWALLLPFAVPTYIIGYTYTDLLQYAGPLQTLCARLWSGPARTTGSRRSARSAARSW